MVQFPVEDPQDSSGGALIGALLKANAKAFIDAVQSEMDKSMHALFHVTDVSYFFFLGMPLPQPAFSNGESLPLSWVVHS